MATSHEGREPPAEARLIWRYREALGISPEIAATRMKIKMTARRWRQIEAGEETKGGKPADAKPRQLAHMARVVGVPPESLEEVGQHEAAEILRVIEAQSDEAAPPADPVIAEVNERLRRDPSLAQAVLLILRSGTEQLRKDKAKSTDGHDVNRDEETA